MLKKRFQAFDFGVPWEDGYGFCQALQAGPFLYVSGQLSHDPKGNFVGEGDFTLQVKTTFENLDRVLAHFKATKEQIVETTVYVRDLRKHMTEISRLHREYFGSHRPTSTVLGVVDLALPQQLVEIAAVAYLA